MNAVVPNFLFLGTWEERERKSETGWDGGHLPLGSEHHCTARAAPSEQDPISLGSSVPQLLGVGLPHGDL